MLLPKYSSKNLCRLGYIVVTGIYACRVCDNAYSYPLPLPPRVSAREVLLELSRTLNSVIDGDLVTATPEDVLRDISRIVSLGIGPRNDDGVYEYVCLPRKPDDGSPSSSYYANNVPSRVNPVNRKLYVNGGCRCLYDCNSVRPVSPPPLRRNDTIARCEKKNVSEMEHLTRISEMTLKPCETSKTYVCSEYPNDKYSRNMAKLPFGLNVDSKRCGNGLATAEYSMVSA